MNEMIKIEDGFQYSVNIAYDLQNKKKLQSFIPTHDALKFIEEKYNLDNNYVTNWLEVEDYIEKLRREG